MRMWCIESSIFFFSSRRRHTRWYEVTGVQTCALPICGGPRSPPSLAPRGRGSARRAMTTAARPPPTPGRPATPRREGRGGPFGARKPSEATAVRARAPPAQPFLGVARRGPSRPPSIVSLAAPEELVDEIVERSRHAVEPLGDVEH